jgi:predicted porin
VKLTILAAFIPVLFIGHSFQVSANGQQSFSNISYISVDDERLDLSQVSINSQYFFEGRPSLGPLNQFEYINKTSNVSVAYQYINSESEAWHWSGKSRTISENTNNRLGIGGEWFSGNLLLGGSYSYVDSEYSRQKGGDSYSDNSDTFGLTAGYLVSDDLLVKVDINKYKNGNSYFTASASYNWQLGDLDYIGFTYSTDESLDFQNLSAKYLMALVDESYLVLVANYVYDNSGSYEDDRWNMGVNYYFNTKTSLSANYDDHDT